MEDSPNGGAKPRQITRRRFLTALKNMILGGALFSVGGWNYGKFERGWIKVNQEAVKINRLPNSFIGVKIAHLSDLHFNTWMTPERFSEIVSMVNEEMPDILLITGDFIDKRIGLHKISEYTELLSKLTARMDKFAVFGNHDHWVDVDVVRKMMAISGVIDVSNKAYQLKVGSESIQICGLDSYMEKKQKLGKVLSELTDGPPAILLVHEPDFADISAVTGRFALQLSGHSHGGQVYVPLYGPLVTPGYGRKYPRGWYKVGEMHLYTNTGIGMVQPYVRFNCRPEIALITLESE